MPAGAADYPDGVSEVKLVEGVTIPTSVAWAPDGGYRDRPECLAGPGSPYTEPGHDYSRAGVGGSVLGGPTYVGGLYPAAYRGSIFFGDYSGRFIRRLVANGSGGYTSVNFATDWSGIGLEEAPNGDLVSLDPGPDFGAGSGAIRRIAFGNGPPNAVARATPQYRSFSVQFDSSATRDPEGDPMSYAWDFDGNGTTDSTLANPSHRYATAGRRTVRLTATDGGGQSDFNEIRVWPGNTPPTLSVGGAQLYRGGERFRLSATTDDPEDSAAPTVDWSVRVIHADHITRSAASPAPHSTSTPPPGTTLTRTTRLRSPPPTARSSPLGMW